MKYYTYYKKFGSKMFFRYLDEKFTDKMEILPLPKILFFPLTKGKSNIKSYPALRPLAPKTFDDWKEYNDTKQSHVNSNLPVYGFNEDRLFLFKEYSKTKDKLKQQFDKMKILSLDIEVYTGQDNSVFPEAKDAEFPISVITVKEIGKNKQFFTFTTREFEIANEFKGITKKKVCKDERELLYSFVKFISVYKPHIITGWNILEYDMYYIANRIKKLFPKDMYMLFANLIPFNLTLKEKMNNLSKFVDLNKLNYILGISILDYLELYKKFSFKKLPSYKLDYVAKHELGEGKVEYEGNLTNLYENDFDLYMKYNFKDVELIDLLEQKSHILKFVIEYSYLTLINFDKALGTIAPAESLLEFFMYKEKLIPRLENKQSKQRPSYPGGYVKQPKAGEYEWVAVFDITSSYPNQIRSYNISLETLISDEELPDEVLKMKRRMLSKIKSLEREDVLLDLDFVEKHITPLLKKYDLCMTPNFDFTSRKIYGIIPKMISFMFNERKKWKRSEKELEQKIREFK